MRIAFTGHRDKLADPAALQRLAEEFPAAVWVHGGAQGFDAQVAATAQALGIEQVVIRPNYREHHPKRAPLVRNEEIVSGSALLVACYDGRKTGGTCYTVEFAGKRGIPVRILTPAEHG